MASLRDEHRLFKAHELRTVSLCPESPYRDNALPRPRCRFALRYYLGLRVDRVADEDWCRELDVIPAEITDRLLAHVADAHAHNHRQRQATVHQRLLELGLCRIRMVEVKRVLVHRQQREPDIVGFGDRAPGTMFVDIADREILEMTPEALAIAVRANLF